jgi:hypothetical protein
MTQRGARQGFQAHLRSRGVEVVEFDFLTPDNVVDYCYERGFLQVCAARFVGGCYLCTMYDRYNSHAKSFVAWRWLSLTPSVQTVWQATAMSAVSCRCVLCACCLQLWTSGDGSTACYGLVMNCVSDVLAARVEFHQS